ncbi:hypothetical protein NI389_08625 [Pseudoalteromonas xiamenensis]|uniref:hypothetical protein n=1 Tax=Pseudoalteromonas xiamenensis TaxID=882626 RepID=UPI0027E5B043|nr:hypothetical protein [Pseudoalteromonas xiamenensis]WMN58338.1 hypothetical protein NI389_08625 [Pseudoalteromonas xiamenensis]
MQTKWLVNALTPILFTLLVACGPTSPNESNLPPPAFPLDDVLTIQIEMQFVLDELDAQHDTARITRHILAVLGLVNLMQESIVQQERCIAEFKVTEALFGALEQEMELRRMEKEYERIKQKSSEPACFYINATVWQLARANQQVEKGEYENSRYHLLLALTFFDQYIRTKTR